MSRTILFLLALVSLTFAYTGDPASGGSGGDDDDFNVMDLIVELNSTCDGNVVTVTLLNGSTVEGAEVDVFDENTLEHLLDDELTGSNGQVFFEGCSRTVRIIASKEDHLPFTKIDKLINCGECGCYEDIDCPSTEECIEDTCQEVECCGIVKDHTCHPYECGDGDLCPECEEGEKCVDHYCRDPCEGDGDCGPEESCSDGSCMPKPECETDSDCKETAECLEIADGLRVCSEITGCCGVVANHTCNLYECGERNESCLQCPEGEYCVDHECEVFDISPAVVDDKILVDIPRGCVGCGIGAIDPMGDEGDYPDNDSHVIIPVLMGGNYIVALKDSAGNVIVKKDVLVTLGEDLEKDFFQTMLESPFFWLAVLMAILIVVVIYMRKRS